MVTEGRCLPQFYIEMNFKKIIKAMDSLDSKQDEINLRFSSKPSGHQHYRSCLQEDQNEDLRIYGRTHKDTIKKFQSLQGRNSDDFTSTPKGNYLKNIASEEARNNSLKHVANPRSKTADNRKKRTQLFERKSIECFLTAENIFTSAETPAGLYKKGKTLMNIHEKPDSALKNGEIKRKSILQFRKHFNKNFPEDVEIAKRLHAVTLHASRSKTCIVQPSGTQAPCAKTNLKENNFFTLTQELTTENVGYIELLSQDYESALQCLNSNFMRDAGKQNSLRGEHIETKGFLRWSRLVSSISKETKIYALSVKDLTIYKFPHCPQALAEGVKALLKDHQMLHLCFVAGGKTTFEELVTRCAWAKNGLSNSLLFLKYLFKRFAFLEKSPISNITDASKKIDQIFLHSMALPHKFEGFLSSVMRRRMWILGVRQNVREARNVEGLVKEGMRHLELQEMGGFGREREGNIDGKRRFYFYICSLIAKSFVLLANKWFTRLGTNNYFLANICHGPWFCAHAPQAHLFPRDHAGHSSPQGFRTL